MRESAKRRGITLSKLLELAKTDTSIDTETDEKARDYARELEEKGKPVIAEGRTMFYFLPESIKVYIKVDPAVGAERIWNDLQDDAYKQKRGEGGAASLDELKADMVARLEVNRKRYQKCYSVDFTDERNYDLVIDSSDIPASEAVEKVVEFVKSQENL